MRVDEFGFGFPPRLFGIRRGETIYSINWIPLGGFVKIQGEDGSEDEKDPGSYGNKSFWQRFAVLVAGVTMNVILAWLLFSIASGIGKPTIISEGQDLPASAKVTAVSVGVLETAENSPASTAGLKPGDAIVSIGGEPVDSIQEAVDLTGAAAGTETIYVIKRGSETFERTLIPRVDPPQGEGALGVALVSVARVSYPWYETLYRGLVDTFNIIMLTLGAFFSIIAGLFRGESAAAALSGPVGIVVLTRDVAQLGFVYLLQFTGLLSVNLAIINAVPFPALDGGRVLFLFIEKIRRKKIPIKAEQLANAIGFVLLITLMVWVTVQDVGRFNVIDRIKNLL
jgi:regulator of sigma E protease